MKDSVKKGDYFVKFTFGEVSDFNHPVNTCFYPVPEIQKWKSYAGASLERNGNVFTVKGNSVQSEISGVRIPYKLSDGFYTIRFKHRSANPITVKLWKGEGTGSIDVAGLHYQNGYAFFCSRLGAARRNSFYSKHRAGAYLPVDCSFFLTERK